MLYYGCAIDKNWRIDQVTFIVSPFNFLEGGGV